MQATPEWIVYNEQIFLGSDIEKNVNRTKIIAKKFAY